MPIILYKRSNIIRFSYLFWLRTAACTPSPRRVVTCAACRRPHTQHRRCRSRHLAPIWRTPSDRTLWCYLWCAIIDVRYIYILQISVNPHQNELYTGVGGPSCSLSSPQLSLGRAFSIWRLLSQQPRCGSSTPPCDANSIPLPRSARNKCTSACSLVCTLGAA